MNQPRNLLKKKNQRVLKNLISLIDQTHLLQCKTFQ